VLRLYKRRAGNHYFSRKPCLPAKGHCEPRKIAKGAARARGSAPFSPQALQHCLSWVRPV
jgi:hypothetical protein